MKRKFGTMINPSAVGNPIVRAFERAIRALIRAQARWRGLLSRKLLTVEGQYATFGHFRTDSLINNPPDWFRPPRGYNMFDFL